MGQQQLLLLVLSIVIVGLAVVVGIQAFTENQQKSEMDRYTEMGVAMAGDVMAFYHKPEATGGAGKEAARLGTMTIADLGYVQDSQEMWGGRNLTGITSGGVRRYLAPDETHPFFHIRPEPLAIGDIRVEVHVFGPSASCIVARNSVTGVTAGWSDGKGENESPDNPDPANCTW